MSVDVLILSSLFDFATDEVTHELECAGVRYVRLNREQLAEHRLTLDPVSPMLWIDGPAGKHVIDDSLRSVYFRQPVFLRNTPASPLSLAEQLDRSQWMAFLRALSVFKRAAWMNSPAATYLAESKPYQLAVAASCGFLVPHTEITNDVTRIRTDFPCGVAIKSLDSVLLRDRSDSLFTYTTMHHSEEIADEAVRSAPLIAQDAIDPKIDIRVTVVGDQVFSVQVLADGRGIRGDWRLTPKSELAYVDVDMSEEDVARCRNLVRQLGLSFGAIDLAEGSAGISFIEVNPTGEWGWLSTEQRPIGVAIAAWLGRGHELVPSH